MTALCGGGTSSPKAGLPSVVDYAVSLIAELLAFRGVRAIVPVLPLINTGALSLSTFCASDPPANPTITSDEADAVLQLRFGPDFDSGIAKFKDIILRTIWYDACECTSGTPVTYVAPTLPTDMPTYQPPVAAATTACKTQNDGTVAITGTQQFFRAGMNYTGLNPTSLKVTVTRTSSGASPPNVQVSWLHEYVFGSPVNIATDSQNYNVNGTYETIIPIHAGANEITPRVTGLGGAGTTNIAIVMELFCGGAVPGGTQTPCCPPDAATQASLDLILRMVTLVQRQLAPFAYVYGDNHTGLSGDGELSPVSGLVGVSVDVTTLPAHLGRAAGTPQQIFEAGFVTLGTADGWATSRRIDSDGTLVLCPPGAGALTRIGYTLAGGVVADIRELVREP